MQEILLCVRLDGLAEGAQSPALPLGNAADNWWLKLARVLREHEISFNPSPNCPSLPLHAAEVPWGKDILTLRWTIRHDICYTPPPPPKLRNSIWVLLLIWCGWTAAGKREWRASLVKMLASSKTGRLWPLKLSGGRSRELSGRLEAHTVWEQSSTFVKSLHADL